jgi:hypothetical protein
LFAGDQDPLPVTLAGETGRVDSDVLEEAVVTLPLTAGVKLAHRRDLLCTLGLRDDRPRALAVGERWSRVHVRDPAQVSQAPIEEVRRTERDDVRTTPAGRPSSMSSSSGWMNGVESRTMRLADVSDWRHSPARRRRAKNHA